MYNIDKQAIGAFIAEMRREKGLTQKALAAQLCISDKAVSKWETATSVPGVDLLVPLSEALGVTVTELLMGQRIAQNPLDPNAVEQVVQSALTYSEETSPRAYQIRSPWGPVYLLSLVIAGLEMLLAHIQCWLTSGLITPMVLGAVFGVYFCFFAKAKLPRCYDENPISIYSDGPFRMNLAGLSLNNRNWGKILTVGRFWSVGIMLIYPLICYIAMSICSESSRSMVDLSLALLFCLAGLLIPMLIIGKKYQ